MRILISKLDGLALVYARGWPGVELLSCSSTAQLHARPNLLPRFFFFLLHFRHTSDRAPMSKQPGSSAAVPRPPSLPPGWRSVSRLRSGWTTFSKLSRAGSITTAGQVFFGCQDYHIFLDLKHVYRWSGIMYIIFMYLLKVLF